MKGKNGFANFSVFAEIFANTCVRVVKKWSKISWHCPFKAEGRSGIDSDCGIKGQQRRRQRYPHRYSYYTVRKVLADFAVCDCWRYCIALCDVKFSQIEENGREFRHKELSYCYCKLSNSAAKQFMCLYKNVTVNEFSPFFLLYSARGVL